MPAAPSRTFRILAWNILHGGGPRRTPEIALALLAHSPDAVVLSEFRAARGSQIRAMLADAGLIHQVTTDTPPDKNGLLIAAKTLLRLPDPTPLPPGAKDRFLEVLLPDEHLRLAGVHIPDDTNLAAKQRYWHFLIAYARAHAAESVLVVGDFNMARRGEDDDTGFACESLMGTFRSLGFVDLWRDRNPGARHATWFNHEGKGFRLDAAYATNSLSPRVQGVAYSELERAGGLSDHALLALDLVSTMRTQSPSQPSPRAPGGGLFPG